MTHGCLVIPVETWVPTWVSIVVSAGYVLQHRIIEVWIKEASRSLLGSPEISQEAGTSLFSSARDPGAWACALNTHSVWTSKTSDPRRQSGD